MKYGYYPGCSLEGISLEYDMSMRALFEALEITIEDLEDWICCGTLAAPSLSHLLGLATPLWNLVRAREQGHDRLVTPCSACLYHFKNAAKQVEENHGLRSDVEAVLEGKLDDLPPAIHPLQLLSSEGFGDRIRDRLSPGRDLSDLKVVCYYGCHISRPAEVMGFDDPENPQSMDQLVRSAGVQVLDWPYKVDCCGAHFSLIKPDIVVELCQKLSRGALDAGADAIIVACPMCHANLDTRQAAISERLDQELEMPVMYFSQLLGYALGLSPKRLGLQKHIVDPLPLMLEKCGAGKEQGVVL